MDKFVKDSRFSDKEIKDIREVIESAFNVELQSETDFIKGLYGEDKDEYGYFYMVLKFKKHTFSIVKLFNTETHKFVIYIKPINIFYQKNNIDKIHERVKRLLNNINKYYAHIGKNI